MNGCGGGSFREGDGLELTAAAIGCAASHGLMKRRRRRERKVEKMSGGTRGRAKSAKREGNV